MNRGYVKLWRKSNDAGWIKNHKLWAFWTWCLMKATHKEFDAIVGLQVIHLMPGQFIFGLKKASVETGLTIREIRTILEFLKKAGNLTIKTTNKFSIITIINWPIYQSNDTENDTLNDKPLTNKGQHTRTIEHKKENPAAIFAEISSLSGRYDSDLLTRTFQAISSTRKTNRIADTVKLSILKSWEQYPVESVMAGIRTYLDKRHHDQGRRENYLLGIIRNLKPEDSMTGGQAMKSTGSALYDAYLRGEIKVMPGARTP
jgi:hypothetical protein